MSDKLNRVINNLVEKKKPVKGLDSEKINKIAEDLEGYISKKVEDETSQDKLNIVLETLDKALDAEKKFEITNLPEKQDVLIRNFDEMPRKNSMEITNFPESFEVKNFPKEFAISNEILNVKMVDKKDVEKVYAINLEEIPVLDLEPFTDPRNPLAVRISNGKEFIDSFSQAASNVLMTAGGGTKGTMGSLPVHNQITLSGRTRLSDTSISIKNGLIVEAISTNSGNVFVGGSDVSITDGFELQPGQLTSIAINDVSSLYAIGTDDDKVCYISSV